jgi:type II secretion system protein C
MTLNIPERYLFAINVLLAALVIPYFAARSVSQLIKLHYAGGIEEQPAAIVEPGAGVGSGLARPRAIYNIIKQRDIFNLAPATEVAAPVEKEDLNIKLLGTSHLTGGARDFAIIEDQSGIQQLYRLGEMIPGVGRLTEIGKNRAIIEHNGRRVAIEIPRDNLSQPGDDAGPPSGLRRGLRPPYLRNPMIRRARPTAKAGGVRLLAPNRYAVERSVVDNSMQHMAQLITEIRALPVIHDGTPNGYRLSDIQPGSLFEQIGLQDGDVLTAVSGQQLSDPAHALRLLGSLQNQANITLNVLRNGAPVQISYTIH